ncbi:MAG TPA: PEP-CTERM sorting domain-containing protein [Pirellulales bacterium]|nr:PEP-CTERM sorting domain-containing protein [Pirellulales bacterium]
MSQSTSLFHRSLRASTRALMLLSLPLLFADFAQAALVKITAAGDAIVGISNTTIGGNDTIATPGTGAGQYATGEIPANAIDNNTGTKYLNFGNGATGVSNATKGVNTGFYVTPAFGNSLITGIQIATANDSPNRDPLTVSLEGSNATGSALDLGSSWTLINNSIDLGIGSDPGRLTFGSIINFANTTPYTSYRVLVQSQRGSDNSVQYSEMNLFGTAPVPEPATWLLFSLGAAGLFFSRRRVR